jgi:hypothetical protein
MKKEEFIEVGHLCTNHSIEISFIIELAEIDLVEIELIDQSHYIHQSQIANLEKMIRMHHELGINKEGIDTVFNLLQKVSDLENELNATKNRLRLYEEF